ncbi:beta strand repeat-containing protein [Nostoc sp. CALU 546]|uniref:beta strand repeat-containing protein n=1 Tax=Nostoc sp. CALU 546 TaxID=1867241 RepID=UPI003B6754D3
MLTPHTPNFQLNSITVNDTGDADDGDANNGITTLREAINLANATPGDDVITFGGVFTDNTPDVITLTSGQLTITDDLTILGTGSSLLTVSGNNASRVFEISGLVTDVSIDGLAIANGNDSGIKTNNNAILSLTNSTVSDNTGSGIFNETYTNVSLTNSTVSDNTGSGIFNGGYSNLSISNSTVSGNTGSGIFNEGGTVSLTNSIVSSNTESGIFNTITGIPPFILNPGNIRLTNSTVSGNTKTGIYNRDSILWLNNSTVSNNTGSGISNLSIQDEYIFSSSSATLTNSTVFGNTNTTEGGGIYNNDALTLINTTITNNTADSNADGTGDGGGVFNDGGTITVGNSIIAGNFDNSTSSNITPDVAGSFSDSGNNLVGNNTGSTGLTTSTLVGTNASPINPQLSPLQNNGGATLTQALLAGSPAIDAGNNSLVSASTDQRGPGFDRISNGVVDIGAYEVQFTSQPPINTDTVVTNTNDSGAGSLRQAILNANATAGADTITFAGVFTDDTPDIITLTSGKLTITDDLTILGTGASNLSISGNNSSGVFEISGTGTDTSINGLKIANASNNFGSIFLNSNASLNLTNSTVSGSTGSVGGIFNRGSLSLTNTTVSDNRGSSLGGGIFNTGNLSLINSSISNNIASIKYDPAYGGGIFNTGNLSITGSTFSNNIAIASGLERGGPNPLPSYGGSIYNSGTVNLNYSTISDSTAESGGGIYNSGIFNLSNSTISGNRGYIDGGGISNSGSLTLANSTITNNNAQDFYVRNADGGGIFNDSDGTVIAGNTIIAGNFNKNLYDSSESSILKLDVSGNFTDVGNNLIGDNTGSTGFTTNSIVGNSVNPIDSKLGPLENNGGVTLTNAPLVGSPAINAGNNALIPVGVTTDQRGAGFDRISGSKVDIGAYEVQTFAGDGGQNKFVIGLNEGTQIITNFGGVGKGTNPTNAVIAEADTLKFEGTGLTARNLLLTQNSSNLLVSFENLANSPNVILQNFDLEKLDNLRKSTGASVDLGNILFDGQTSIEDSFDVFDANSTQSTVFGKNRVTFLNDLNNNVNGLDNSNDVISSQGGNDRIDGKSGNDLLRGGAGDDTLIGGSGNDILIAGAGNDILTGGSGNDQFVYQALNDIGDTITDFNQSEDQLDLSDLFRSLDDSGIPGINQYLQFVQSGTSTQVQIDPDGFGGIESFNTFVTLNNFTATNLVVGTNVFV